MLSYWLVKHLDPDWRVAHKAWSLRLAIFWGCVSGMWMALPAFQYFMPPFYFALLCIIFAVSIAVARITNQPGMG